MNKIIKRRPNLTCERLVEDPLLDRLYRSRHIQCADQLNYSLQAMLSPFTLHNVDKAVELLVNAYQQQRKIVIVGDFDADGATSTALTVLALRQLGFKQVDYLVPDRFEQGYGLTIPVAEMAIAKGVELLITVDNGVSSLEGVEFLKKQGIQVLITDHHLPPETLPDADAIVNPNLPQCEFPSKNLAGVGVAFYVMLALRSKLRELGIFTQQSQPNFSELLDLVALGTIADVVTLDQNNRILAYQGLQRIRANRCCFGLQALAEVAKRKLNQFKASDLAFSIAPRLNAAGRLDNMSLGVQLLLAKDLPTARALALDLDDLNQTRKEIEQGMKLEALEICRNFNLETTDLPFGIALYQPDWHQGVLGIVAARLKDKFFRPVVVFAQDQDNLLKGSARSIEGLHLRDLLAHMNSQYPKLMVKFGGHAMAAGLTIKQENFTLFQQIFNQMAKQVLQQEQLQNIIWTDGELLPQQLNLATADLLNQQIIWGKDFPEPLFDGEFRILSQKLMGQQQNHLKMMVEPKEGGGLIDAVMFNVDRQLYPDLSIKLARLAYRLEVNEFNQRRNIQLLVDYIEPLA